MCVGGGRGEGREGRQGVFFSPSPARNFVLFLSLVSCGIVARPCPKCAFELFGSFCVSPASPRNTAQVPTKAKHGMAKKELKLEAHTLSQNSSSPRHFSPKVTCNIRAFATELATLRECVQELRRERDELRSELSAAGE